MYQELTLRNGNESGLLRVRRAKGIHRRKESRVFPQDLLSPVGTETE